MTGQSDGGREALLLLGMHRSGTSALALAYQQLGWELGRDLLAAKPEINQYGFGENRQVVDFNDRLLVSYDRQWFQQRPLPTGWHEQTQAQALIDEAAAIIDDQYAGLQRFLIKDPRLCLTLPIWLQSLQDLNIRPRIILALRHPESVARSIEQRDRLPVQVGYLLWLQYYLHAARDSEQCERRVIRYEDLLHLGAPALRVFDDIEIPDDMDCGLDPALCHHAAAEYSQSGPIVDLCERTLAAFAVLANTGSTPANLPDPEGLLAGVGLATLAEVLDQVLAGLVSLSGETVDIGALHSHALQVIAEKDAQLADKNTEIADSLDRLAGRAQELLELRSQFVYRVLRKLRLLR